MRVIVISKRLIQSIIIGLFGVAMLIGVCRYFAFHYEQVAGYQIRQQFPPLVYLPASAKKPFVSAEAAVLLEVKSGAVLFDKNAEVRRAPASTTKIMTALVALEKGNLERIVTVSRRAAGTPGSTIWLRPGQRLVLKELLQGMMLCSGNDGSIAVAEGVAGNLDVFVRLMNLKAKELGALQTNFRNPHGLRAPSHYTTALDLALITRYALTDPRFAKLVKTKSAQLEWIEQPHKVDIQNTNKLLWSMQGVDGVKTGTTNEAGHCLVASATRDGKKFVAVILKSCNRWGDAAKLLEYGFQNFSIVQLAKANHPITRLAVKGSLTKSVALVSRRDLIAVVEKGTEGLLKTEMRLAPSPVQAPVLPGQCLGKIGYRYNDQWVEAVDLINLRPIKRDWKRWLW